MNDLVLTSSGLPLNAAAYFLCSRTQGFVQNPGGSAGDLCLGNPIGRLVGGVAVNSGATGVVDVTADLNVMPQPTGAVAVLPGETWNFQCWYRDAAGGSATSNFSDGLAVLFSGSPTPVPTMVPIPAGTFLMGSNAPSGPPYYGELTPDPVRQVTISYSFWMGQHEVTQAEYQALMGTNPSLYQVASHPVDTVSWSQSRAYCAAPTAQQAGNLPAGYEYRLPTEAEWEYACRAGTTTEFHYGPDLFCNQASFGSSYHSNPPTWCGNTSPVPVGTYAQNAFGLYDMHGNVSEWCLDSHAPYTSAAVTDPFVTGGPFRVFRGGSWFSDSDLCRSAFRYYYIPGLTNYRIGFRVVLAPVLVP
ncbi:MAG: formylglycine-generating enzyme family protein [Planctomycetota bacterium]